VSPNDAQFPKSLPNPTAVPPSAQAVGRVCRLVFCAMYQHCLDVAVKNDWDDWTCSHCPLSTQKAAPSAAQWATHQPKE
jgi:hypothetical protein